MSSKCLYKYSVKGFGFLGLIFSEFQHNSKIQTLERHYPSSTVNIRL